MKNVQYPPFVHWEVTPECNHNCIHCYNYWRKSYNFCDSHERQLTEDHYLRIAHKIIEQKAHTAVVTGGEPLLVFDKVKSSMELLRKNGINISINTNAVLVSDEIIAFLKQYGIGMFISFPCAEETVCDFITNRKGSLKKILHSLDCLVKNGIQFSLNIVVSKANIDYLEQTIDFLRDRYHIKKIYITRVGKPVNADSSFDKFLLSQEDLDRVQDISVKTKYEYGIDVDTGCPYTLCSINSQKSFELFGYKKFCTAGKTSYALDTFGNLKACPRDSKIYGNIFEESFSDIWERVAEWRDGSLLPEECKQCKHVEICKGGCRVDAFPFTGKLNSLDTTTNLENLPIKYIPKSTAIPEFFDDDTFIKNPFTCVKEDFGYRISYRQSYIFITEELKRFLDSKSIFNRSDIVNDFSVDSTIANRILSRLAMNGIIQVVRR